jgi:hypothetical protein
MTDTKFESTECISELININLLFFLFIFFYFDTLFFIIALNMFNFL